MLESAPISLLAGTILGLLAGLGVGGGSLLMLWLTLVIHMEYSQARTINLLFFIPAALICSLFRLKQGSLPFKKIWPAMCAGVAAAIVGSLLCRRLDMAIIKKLFGLLLLFTGLRELFYRPRKAR